MKIIYLILSALIVLLFVGGPDYESHRIVTNIWDYGHVILFFGLSSIYLNINPFKQDEVHQKFLTIVILSLIIGLSIEIIQVFVERNFDVFDVLNDLYGALIGYFVNRYQTLIANPTKKGLALLFATIFTLLSLSSIIKVTFDEYLMRQEFPVLADFESPFELTRWDTHLTKITKSKIQVKNNQYSMKAIFFPGEYSDITLQHFVRNWAKYKTLSFNLYSSTKRMIELKIYDEAHISNNYSYNDRFNREIILHKGWNNIEISLSDIINSPKNRKIDITQIKSFSLFLNDVKQPVTLYFDNLKLE